MLPTAGGDGREWVGMDGDRQVEYSSTVEYQSTQGFFRPQQQGSLATILPNIGLGPNDDVWSVQGGRLLQVMGRAGC